MIQDDFLIKSYIQNNKKVLVWTPGSNIDGNSLGLGFGCVKENNNNLFYIQNKDNISKYKNQSFDYFFVHGFEAREYLNPSLFKENNIKINKLIIDYLGEGFSLNDDIRGGNLIKKYEPICNQLIILTGFKVIDNIKSNYPNVRFFEHDLSGPRFFCSPYSRNMVHNEYYKIDTGSYISKRWVNDSFIDAVRDDSLGEVIMGLKWNDKPKSKLFCYTPGTPRPFRILLQKEIENNDLLEYGHISFKRNDSGTIRMLNDKGDVIDYLCITKHCQLDEKMFDTIFALHRPITSDSYISVISESAQYKDVYFITEKCVKPFYTLQFPIIQGHDGIVSDLRKMDFDMFDDIIDHSYDNIPTNDTIHNTTKSTIDKSKLMANEIVKLKNKDIHKLYLKNKERFIYNQENLYKKTISENDIFKKMAKFIFGNDLKVVEPNQSLFKKVWI